MEAGDGVHCGGVYFGIDAHMKVPISDGSLQCACIYNFKRKGRWDSRKCRNVATREVSVHQENEHPQVGTGWYWIPLCEKHFHESVRSEQMTRGEDWRWVYYP